MKLHTVRPLAISLPLAKAPNPPPLKKKNKTWIQVVPVTVTEVNSNFSGSLKEWSERAKARGQPNHSDSPIAGTEPRTEAAILIKQSW